MMRQSGFERAIAKLCPMITKVLNLKLLSVIPLPDNATLRLTIVIPIRETMQFSLVTLWLDAVAKNVTALSQEGKWFNSVRYNTSAVNS